MELVENELEFEKLWMLYIEIRFVRHCLASSCAVLISPTQQTA
jgi:hypothetical protein